MCTSSGVTSHMIAATEPGREGREDLRTTCATNTAFVPLRSPAEKAGKTPMRRRVRVRVRHAATEPGREGREDTRPARGRGGVQAPLRSPAEKAGKTWSWRCWSSRSSGRYGARPRRPGRRAKLRNVQRQADEGARPRRPGRPRAPTPGAVRPAGRYGARPRRPGRQTYTLGTQVGVPTGRYGARPRRPGRRTPPAQPSPPCTPRSCVRRRPAGGRVTLYCARRRSTCFPGNPSAIPENQPP